MPGQNTITDNINVFEYLNIYQLRLSKKNPQFNDFFTIWCVGLKPKV